MLKTEELAWDKNGDGLIPAVIQDERTLAVLMLGYMNREALSRTIEEKRVTFFSRSKGRLWTKGETSGNFFEVVRVIPDCDNDTILVRVIPAGPACHNGTRTCFAGDPMLPPAGGTNRIDDTEGFIRQLQYIISKRHEDMPEGSYTTKLFNKGVAKIAQKVGEEAVETVIDAVAGNRNGFLYEASDLIYHLLVLLEANGCSIADLEKELASRHK